MLPFKKWEDTTRQFVPRSCEERSARMLPKTEGQFYVRDLALAREPEKGLCPPQQGVPKRRPKGLMQRQRMWCIQRGSGRG